MALLEQLLPQLPVVVDFAVEGENLGAVFVENGLAAAGEVDYGQPPETHGDALVNVVIGLVGAAVGDAVRHGPDDGETVPSKAVGGKPGKSAHLSSNPFGVKLAKQVLG